MPVQHRKHSSAPDVGGPNTILISDWNDNAVGTGGADGLPLLRKAAHADGMDFAATAAEARAGLDVYSQDETDALLAAQHGLPAGGTAGQLLTKTSATDYAAAWSTLAANAVDTPQIKDKGVTGPKLRDSAGVSVIGRSVATAGEPADIVAGQNENVLRRSGNVVGFGAINLAVDQAVTGILRYLNGGTAQNTWAKGDLLSSSTANNPGRLPIGSTNGQVLTVNSAATFGMNWAAPTTPILANNTSLQGYKADAVTPQNLIGMTTTDDIFVGPSLAAGKVIRLGALTILPNNQALQGYRSDGTTGQHLIGVASDNSIYIAYGSAGDIKLGDTLTAGKNIYVPRLICQGALYMPVDVYLQSLGGANMLAHGSDGYLYLSPNASIRINTTAGQSEFGGSVFVAGTLNKTGVGPYTHPDYVFEHEYTGAIVRFREAPGAQDYEGLWPLDLVEAYAREHWSLPHHAPREDDRVDVFRRTHDLLAECERLYLHLFDHEKRLAALERR